MGRDESRPYKTNRQTAATPDEHLLGPNSPAWPLIAIDSMVMRG